MTKCPLLGWKMFVAGGSSAAAGLYPSENRAGSQVLASPSMTPTFKSHGLLFNCRNFFLKNYKNLNWRLIEGQYLFFKLNNQADLSFGVLNHSDQAAPDMKITGPLCSAATKTLPWSIMLQCIAMMFVGYYVKSCFSSKIGSGSDFICKYCMLWCDI